MTRVNDNTMKKLGNDYVFSLNENLLWMTAAIFIALSTFADTRYGIVLLFWVFIIVINGNAKRLFSQKFNGLTTFLRRSCYVLPLFLPVLISDFELAGFMNSRVEWIAIGSILGTVFLVPKVKEYRLMLSKDFIQMSNYNNSRIDNLTNVYMSAGAAVGEEIFFRGFMIGYLFVADNAVNTIVLIALSSFVFFMNHFGLKWGASFPIYDRIVQIAFGAVSSVIFIFSGSILPSMAMHLVYNSPHVIVSVKKLYLSPETENLKQS